MAEAADTIQRRVAEAAIIPVEVEADAPPVAAAVAVTTAAAEAVDTRAAEVEAAAPVAEDTEVTAKKLGDATSLREAAT